MKETYLELLEKYKTTDSISFAEKVCRAMGERTEVILGKIYEVYNSINHLSLRKFYNWWAWKYYEGEDSTGPELDVRTNLNISNGKYFINFYVDSCSPIIGLIDGKEVDIGCNIPLEWFDLSDKDLEAAIIDSINKYQISIEDKRNAAIVQRAAKKKEKAAADSIKKEVLDDLYKKLSEKELWAVGLRKSYPEYHGDVYNKVI